MRLWSLHPKYLDSKGLVACWREALLAQAVLAGKTVGYQNHPQLVRFRSEEDPGQALADFLWGIWDEATARGYRFSAEKILYPASLSTRLPVTGEQLAYEAQHLKEKLLIRSPQDVDRLLEEDIMPHPIFYRIPGAVEPWEKVPKS